MLGFYRLAAAVPRLFLADVKSNAREIIKLYKEASENGAADEISSLFGIIPIIALELKI